jgi:hypothetical protein
MVDKKIYSRLSLWQEQAPSFGFELDEDQLLHLALERGFVKEVGVDAFELNEEYASNE